MPRRDSNPCLKQTKWMVDVNEWRNNVARVCSGMVLKLDALVLLDEDEA